MQQTSRTDKAHWAPTVIINKSLNSELYTMHTGTLSKQDAQLLYNMAEICG